VAIPKNALTTSTFARSARGIYRSQIRRATREAIIASRLARGSRRSHTPDYLIVGVQKCGTTGLFDSLTKSPWFASPLTKEVHFFDLAPHKSVDWYRSHFWGRDTGLRLWGEATPSYFDTPSIPSQVSEVLGDDVRIIILLRDPVSRAISHYHHSVDFGFEKRTLVEAFQSELNLLSHGQWSNLEDFRRYGYLSRSRYSASIRRWHDYFPADKIHICIAERRYESLASVGAFLLPELDAPFKASDVRNSNRRPYPSPDLNELGRAVEALASDAEKVRQMLGWSTVPSEWSHLSSL
jgi:hypothetical protein